MKSFALPVLAAFATLALTAASCPAYAWVNHYATLSKMTSIRMPAEDRARMASSADEPDQGMDQNLDPKFDPLNERKWMGGTTGPTSQGFRHMYFGGWKLSHPLTTFQIPTQAIGQAPNRVLETAAEAKDFLKSGNRAEGLRHLAWSAHYLQDLAQPFHAVQIVHLGMVPWSTLTGGFESLVKETTRTISNYHWAYEGYVEYHLKEGAYDVCLASPAQATLKAPAVPSTSADYPKALALAVVEASIGLASELGAAEMEKYGPRLKDPEIDLSHDKGSVDYNPRAETLDRVTCKALSNAARATELLVEWALHP